MRRRRRPVPDHRFARVSRSGRGLAINLPRAMLDQLGWHYGTTVELWLSGQSLVAHAVVSARDQADLEATRPADLLPGGVREP